LRYTALLTWPMWSMSAGWIATGCWNVTRKCPESKPSSALICWQTCQ